MHAAYEDDFKIYIIIDTIRGVALFDRIIKQGQLPEADCAMIMQRILSVVRYLHGSGYSLRNLRTETILFENDTSLYDIKFVDLLTLYEAVPARISTDEEDRLFDRVMKGGGHILNHAPELIRPLERDYGYKCDVWAAGCILYNMLTGIPPFYETSE